MGWLSRILPTIGMVALGIITGGISWITGAITVFSAIYADRQQQKAEKAAREQMEAWSSTGAVSAASLMFMEPTAPRRIVYGRDVKISGNIIMAHIPTTDKNSLYMVIALADHELTFPSDVLYVNDDKITAFDTVGNWKTPTAGSFHDYVFVRWCTVGSVADAALVAEIPTIWTAAHTLTGISYLVVKLVWNADVFPNGRPNIATRCDGRKCYDPRTTLTAVTENPALCLLDYLRSTSYGMGIADANLDMTASEWQAEADTCDEAVDSETRYKIHAVFTLDQTPYQIIGAILDCCAGRLPYIGGIHYLRVGKYRAPTVTLDEDDMRGRIEVTTRRSLANLMNQVQGVFCDPATDQPANYPVVKNATYISNDGGTIPFTLDLPYVNQPGQCQRIANIMMERNRREISVISDYSPTALRFMPADAMQQTFSRYGWSAKAFEVQSMGVKVEGGKLTVPLFLQETDANVYADPSESTYDPSTATNLPSAYDVDDPTNLAVSEKLIAIGDIVGNKVTLTWDEADTYNLKAYLVSYKLSSASDWIDVGTFNNSTRRCEIRIDDADDYDFRVRTENFLGAKSSGATLLNQTIYGKTLPPSDLVDLTAAIEGEKIRLDWTKVADLDVKVYEIQYSSTAAAWDGAGATIKRVSDVDTVLIDAQLSGTWTFRIKALDTTGHYSNADYSTTLTVSNPATPADKGSNCTYNTIKFFWSNCFTSFPINHYEIYRGSSFATATLIGENKTTNFAFVEYTSGLNTYYIRALDIAGNVSGELTLSFTVTDPPDFKLVQSWNDDFSGTCVNVQPEDIIGPDGYSVRQLKAIINTTQLNDDIGDRTDDFVIENTTLVTSGSYEQVFDYGADINGAVAIFEMAYYDVTGTLTITPTVSFSADGVSYTDYAGVWSYNYTSTFRYIKIHIDFAKSGTADANVICITSLKSTIKRDRVFARGTITIPAGGELTTTFATLGLTFIDVDAILLTSQTTDIVQLWTTGWRIANPTEFTAYARDINGDPIGGDVAYYIEGT